MKEEILLSILIPTSHPWPAVERCFRSIRNQINELNAELIVLGSDQLSLPLTEYEGDAKTKFFHYPDTSVFGLRALGLRHAQGEIIAITEDHAEVCEQWCIEILNSFENDQKMLSLTGPMYNLSDDHAIDRANFLLTFSSFMSPLESAPENRSPPIANISLRRVVLSNKPEFSEGWLEFILFPQLTKTQSIDVNPRVVVGHRQSHSFSETCTFHFHNGRVTGALLTKPINSFQYIKRLVAILSLPLFLFLDTSKALISKGVGLYQLFLCSPQFLCLGLSTTYGQLAGLFFGKGDSAYKLE